MLESAYLSKRLDIRPGNLMDIAQRWHRRTGTNAMVLSNVACGPRVLAARRTLPTRPSHTRCVASRGPAVVPCLSSSNSASGQRLSLKWGSALARSPGPWAQSSTYVASRPRWRALAK